MVRVLKILYLDNNLLYKNLMIYEEILFCRERIC